MDKLVAQFPKQIVDALELASKSDFSRLAKKSFQNIVICGMGGSGMGGKMASQVFSDKCKIPIILVQDYFIPSFINENTLCIISSYSGNTEETLSALIEADKKGAEIIGISSGGEIIKYLQKKNYNFTKLPGGNPPRSMLAFSFIQIVNILTQAKLIDGTTLEEIKDCRNFLNNEIIPIKQEAEKLAKALHQKRGILYTDAQLEFIIIRARQQFNENSKQLISHHTLPEMNHNELVGWEGGNKDISVVFFNSKYQPKRIQQRIQLSKQIIQQKTDNIIDVNGKGRNKIEEIFYFIHIIDWASIFLANLNNVDPLEIKSIIFLKDELNKLK